MRLVRQRRKNDWGLAVAAMICGTSYRAASEAGPHPEYERGLSCKDLLKRPGRERVSLAGTCATSSRRARRAAADTTGAAEHWAK
jgi:hypothetical protein